MLPHATPHKRRGHWPWDISKGAQIQKRKQHMRYLLLIYTSEAQDAQATPEQMEAVMGAYYAFTKELTDSGKNRGGEALQPIATATTVRVRNGKTVTTDGPFAETKEQLGGYYMVDADNLDEAIAWAAKIPGAQIGSIEVRPVMEFEQ